MDCFSPETACSSISAGVILSSNGDTVHLSPGTYVGNGNTNIMLNTSITIQSDGGYSTLELQSMDRAFVVSVEVQVTLMYMIIQNGVAELGGAIVSDGNNSITIMYCTFNNNSAMDDGGAIYLGDRSFAFFSGVSFVNNSAMNGGGALSIDACEIAMNDCLFYDNDATYGGAIYIADSRLNLTNANFSMNFADSIGGAIHMTSVTRVRAKSSIFTNNVANQEGGAVYIFLASTLYADNTTFTNSIAYNGGALSVDTNGGTRLTNCTFSQNVAINGAAILVDQGGIFTNSTAFINNVAYGHGGAIYYTDEGWGSFNDIIIANNVAGTNGGALYVFTRSMLTFTNSTIINNYAMENGGGIFCSDSKIDLENVMVSNNRINTSSDANNFYCASYPAGTYCTIQGDAEYADNHCGFVPYTSSTPTLPMIALIGIVLGGLGIVFCVIVIVGLIIWKRKANKDKQAWKQLKLTKEGHDTELLEDYD